MIPPDTQGYPPPVGQQPQQYPDGSQMPQVHRGPPPVAPQGGSPPPADDTRPRQRLDQDWMNHVLGRTPAPPPRDRRPANDGQQPPAASQNR
jgi:hypothetical protein